MAGFHLRHVLGGAGGNDLPAAIAAFGTDVDDPIGGFDHIEVMLDDDDRIALIDQFVQHFQKFAHILKVQARRGFVQDIKRSPGGPAREFLGQFHPLRLAPGQGRGLLAP